METFSREVLSREALGPPMVALYAREFTEAELQELIGFYQRPTGRKLFGSPGSNRLHLEP
jgi:hypothetical protein